VPREVYRFAVTVPHGTLKTTPLITALSMPERVVRKLTVTVPPGPRGLVGFQMTSGGAQVIPINAGQFLVMDGRTREWDLDDYMTSGAWQLTAYNTGSFDHTLEIVFDVDLVPLPGVTRAPQLIESTALSSSTPAR
jgi:hypothetical protein